MKYAIYFHWYVETSEDLDWDEKAKDYVPNGTQILAEENMDFLLIPNMTIKLEEADKKLKWMNFQCWLNFEAPDDDIAIKMADEVSKDCGIDWIQVCYLLEMPHERKVAQMGMDIDEPNLPKLKV